MIRKFPSYMLYFFITASMFEKKRLCPVLGCSSQFKYKVPYASHLRDVHGMDESDVQWYLETNSSIIGDTFPCMVKCTVCGSDWKRRSHMKRHLTVGKHNMGDDEALQLIERLLKEVCLFLIKLPKFISFH